MYVLPTLGELAHRTRLAFRAHLKGSDASLWPNNIYVAAKVLAGKAFEIFGFAAYIAKQMFAHTAPDIESLRMHGEEFGIPQKPAQPATGKVTFTSSGALTVNASAVLERGDGVQYLVVDGGGLPGAGALQVSVVAVRDGVAGNAVGGTALTIVSGVTGDTTAEVASGGLALGAEIEDIESYRARILFRKRNPPHGGAPADYVMWAGEVAGVSFDVDRPTVFVERVWAGPGTVRVFPLMFDLYPDGIPQGVDVARVAAHIASVAPAGAVVAVAAPVAVPLPITITGLSPDNTDVREAVLAELRETFRRLSRVAGNDSEVMPYLAYPTSFSRSWIWQAVANATGEQRHEITSPVADIALAAGEMATLGTVTFA